MNDEFSEFFSDFLVEAEEHITNINNYLLEIESQFKQGEETSYERINAIFRAVHTIKGLSGMLGFEPLQKLAHAMEDLMGEVREGKKKLSEPIFNILFLSSDRINQMLEEIKLKGSTTTSPDDIVNNLREIISNNIEKKESPSPESINLDFIDFKIPIDDLKITEIESALLRDVISKDLNVFMVVKEIAGGISEDKFNKLPIFKDIDNCADLILYRPTIENIILSKKDSIFCYFIFSSNESFDTIKDKFFDEIKVLRVSLNLDNKKIQESKMAEESNFEVFRLKDAGFDESIVAEFFEEVDELVESLDMNLLELEKSPQDSETLNAIFRVAHTIKGASSMFGFEPIVKLTHSMENLFDNLRKGSLIVNSQIMDIFFQGVDLLKSMLSSLKNKGIIDQNFIPIVKNINDILNNKGGSIPSSKSEADISEVKDSSKSLNSSNGLDIDLDPEFYNALSEKEINFIGEEIAKGNYIYEVDIIYPQDVLQTTFKPFEGLFTGIEIVGELISVLPDIGKVPELSDYDIEKFYISLKVIISSNLSFESFKSMLAGFSDTMEMNFKELNKRKDDHIKMMNIEDKKDIKIQNSKPQEPIIVKQDSPILKQEAPSDSQGKDKADSSASKKSGANTIRVDLERLDKLLNLVGEFVIDRTRFAQISQELREKFPHDPLIVQLNETNQIFGRHMNEIQEVIMSVRMIPIGNTFNKYPRIVRDLAKDSEKEINLEISGQETELDKTLVEEIGDPLVHLIRNAIDHGIEKPEERIKKGKPKQGTIKLSAHHEGNHIVITISDDGNGIDTERVRLKAIEKGLIREDDNMSKKDLLNLIFEPGFSTAAKVTNISGRGVGMDVVKRNISKLKGIVDIDTFVGQGTTIKIKLPLTLAIIQVLMVQVASEIFAIPLPSIIETIRIAKNEIQIIENYEMITLRDSVLPIARIKDIFELDDKSNKGSLSYNNELELDESGKYFIVIVGLAEQRVGLIVDRLITQQEVVIKSLGALLKNSRGIAGATILGNGKVALILDIGEVIEGLKSIGVATF